MEHLLGLLSIHVQKGVNLATKDIRGSDPYIIFRIGEQVKITTYVKNMSLERLLGFNPDFTNLCKDLYTRHLHEVYMQTLKTRVIKNSINPVWDEVVTIAIFEPLPIKMEVYDKDTFSSDDDMGDAEFDIKPFIEALKMHLDDLPDETIISTVKPTRTNCLSEESSITWTKGKVIQNMVLRLRNVVSGEIEIQLGWINVPGSKGLR